MNTNQDFLKTLVSKPVEGATSESQATEKVPTNSNAFDLDLKIEKSQKREQIAINLKPDLVQKLEKLSRKNGCSRSKVIETLLEKVLK